MFSSSEEYTRHYSQSHYYFLWAVVADRIRRDGLSRILEIGCGPGQLASMLFDQGITAYAGMDFSAAAIAMARSNAPRGQFEVGDARTTDIHQRYEHDVVVCTEVLEHVQDDLQIIDRFLPGKRCLCSVPNFPHESHVRCFENAFAVRARYGPYFDGLDVATFKSSIYLPDQFFLFDGIRNGNASKQPS